MSFLLRACPKFGQRGRRRIAAKHNQWWRVLQRAQSMVATLIAGWRAMPACDGVARVSWSRRADSRGGERRRSAEDNAAR